MYYTNTRLVKRFEIIKPYISDQHQIAAEIGVLHGEFSRELLTIPSIKKLYLVDPWCGDEKRHEAWGKWALDDFARRNNINTPGDSINTINAALSGDIQNNKVEVVVDTDVNWISTLDDNYLDMVYYDGCHTHVGTLAGLIELHRVMKSTGIVLGDDWAPRRKDRHHGVYLAVHEAIDMGLYKLEFADVKSRQYGLNIIKE